MLYIAIITFLISLLILFITFKINIDSRVAFFVRVACGISGALSIITLIGIIIILIKAPVISYKRIAEIRISSKNEIKKMMMIIGYSKKRDVLSISYYKHNSLVYKDRYGFYFQGKDKAKFQNIITSFLNGKAINEKIRNIYFITKKSFLIIRYQGKISMLIGEKIVLNKSEAEKVLNSLYRCSASN